ncbi:MAG: sulfatase [bacterium]
MNKILWILGVGCATWLLALWAPEGPCEAASADVRRPDAAAASALPDIVIISLDTTRADHLSLHGYPLSTTPNLERIGKGGIVFEQARTVVPLTGPSHASMFTSLYPHQHGCFRNGIPLRKDVLTLARILKERGYDTAAFVSSWTLKGTLCGLDSGFRLYREDFTQRYSLINREQPADEVARAVAGFLDSGEHWRPLFLFVHFFDPHAPYRRHPGPWEALGKQAGDLGLDLPRTVLEYDNELAYMDHHLGLLLETLERRGLLESGLVWIVGDHGESLGEHGYTGHGRRVYEQMMHVPLVLLARRWAARTAVVKEVVSTLDIVPTTLGFLGKSAPLGDPAEVLCAFEGMDLSGHLVQGTTVPSRRLYFETFKGTLRRFTPIFAKDAPDHPLFMGYYENNMKYILGSSSGREVEIYDLKSDPGETRNMRSRSGASFSPAELLSWFQQGRSPHAVKVDLSPDDVETLRSLGYID